MQVEIITPDKEIFKGEAILVQLPGIDGSFEILNNHAPLISALKDGKIKVKKTKESGDEFYDIKGGVIEVLNNKVLILAE
ncbi:MAG: ATP synthase F1 subunit epsilon [bacterium]|jgi:F-type H+-transporting ATPase subunit epsilon